MDEHFAVLMHKLYGFDVRTPMRIVTSWIMDNFDKLWEQTKIQGEFQEKLEALGLPPNVVFIDVNGTLFPDDSENGYIPEGDIELFQETLVKAQTKGLSIGLCSDSPLPQLIDLAKKLGIDGPIIAENGNILYYKDKMVIIESLSDIEKLKREIAKKAYDSGFIQVGDWIAPEFGGRIDSSNLQWGLGANRITSITVFGPPSLIQRLGESFKDGNGFSIDCSPEYNYLAIHPGKDFRSNKGKTLNILSVYGHNIMMIGNSMSDWVDPEMGVKCVFASESRINSEISQKAAYISNKPFIKGVVDII
ncbi:HAD family phosphatase [Candidatus Gottesmanbacteria bacterium]|nr:HAD family phosphatase [Candidatus Gottesmanbacteria bacterium]